MFQTVIDSAEYLQCPNQNISLFINSIFGEIGDYDPTATTREHEKKEKTKERERKKSKNSTSYFEKSEGGADDEVCHTELYFVKNEVKLLVVIANCVWF